MICSRIGCERPATHAPKVCVPALRRGRPSLDAVLTLVTCEACMARLSAADFLDPDDPGGAQLRATFGMQAAGRYLLDFDAAWLDDVALTSAEWRDVERVQAARRGPVQ